eukprot:gnl/TRDRNA2_/TRDRNA2_157438_c0_seq3.p1 gnl/TRDRNA2_/TRDRNA2_157438_c0~~gnl/TRDRNA2_/TRDRNA2_157438_c0_seq3.p1  ORF type:complete len:117 (+),score=13.77 gnl/TRDRNA2_/TRDRNA2_157438_c0_seq3:99-449(+)
MHRSTSRDQVTGVAPTMTLRSRVEHLEKLSMLDERLRWLRTVHKKLTTILTYEARDSWVAELREDSRLDRWQRLLLNNFSMVKLVIEYLSVTEENLELKLLTQQALSPPRQNESVT